VFFNQEESVNRVGILGIVVLTVMLSACGGNSVPNPPPVPPPPPLTTPPGTNVGSPVTQTISASGGTVTAGGVKLEVLPGTVTNANVTLQPITDTLNGAGQGIAISSDAAWSKYAKITFPIDANDDYPEGLGLAVQQSDGSWLSLNPVKVDTAAGTVTAGLPATLGSSSLRAQAGLQLTSVVKFKRFYLKPSSATVKVKGTKSFTAYAQVIQNEKKDPNCGAPDPNDPEDLAPLCAFRRVTREYPFTNDKDGFARSWSVNGAFGGNGTVGTISKSGSSGATYTAPDKKPSPDTVTVIFQSINTDSLDSVTLKASVKITDDVIQSYAGSVNFNGSNLGGVSYSGQGNLTWNLIEHLPNDLSKYEASGSVQATATYPDCTPATASVPVNGTMIVFDPVRGGPGDTFASKYWFSLVQGANVLATAQCGNPPTPTQVPVTFLAITTCTEVPTLPTAPKYTDIALLTGSGSWPCQFNTTTADWNFKAQ
jgi:hypothetical protein